MKINSLADYNQWQQELLQEKQEKTVLICCETGCRAGGSLEVAAKFEELIQAHNLPVGVKRIVKKTGCQGMCEKGPIVWIMPEGIFYCLVKEKDVPEIVERTLEKGEIVERLLYRDKDKNCTCEHHNDIDFFKKQHPLVLAHMGQIDPTDIRDYIRVNGYKAAVEVLTTKDPDYVMEQIEKSNLRGRGGGGFPTGKKWRSCKELEGPRYIICNGDEGDPGAFMDRSVMEGDPHAILEGMILGAFAVGANEGYIYVRHEYPSAVEHLNIAIKQAEELEVETENNKPSPNPMLAREQTEQQTKVEQPQEKNQQTETAQYRINVKTLPQVKEMAKRLLPTVGQIKPEDYALACDLAIEYALTFEGVWAQRIGDRDRNEQEG